MTKERYNSVCVNNIYIYYYFSEFGIHIVNNTALKQLALINNTALKTLCYQLFEKFYVINNRRLKFSLESFEIEVWGHLYFEGVWVVIKRIFFFKWFKKIYKRLNDATILIDCAEKKEDNNRWIWDGISITYPLFIILNKYIKKIIIKK